MKRLNWVAPVTLLAALPLTACGSNPGGSPPPTSNFGGTYSRNVSVLNWTAGSLNFTDAPLSVNLNASGVGTITLASEPTPPTQDRTLSSDLASNFGCPTSGLTITGDTRTFDGLFDFYGTDANKAYTYVVDLATEDTTFDPATGSTNHTPGGKDADFYFVNQNFTLTGTATCGTYTVTFDVTLAPGWNLVSFSDLDRNSWTVRNDVEAGMNWRSLPLQSATGNASAVRDQQRGTLTPRHADLR